ncbi:MAG TPA: hypothetical protein VFT74_05620 [Isosphaeraceae bacterium]|nr:hypothetical protein [Isosphaeraceae bacterium]
MPQQSSPEPKFPLGKLVATPGAIRAMMEAKQGPLEFLARHVSGDWGDVPEEDKAANDADLEAGGRLLSSYRLTTSVKLWIITEADRSATTILLPEEY